MIVRTRKSPRGWEFPGKPWRSTFPWRCVQPMPTCGATIFQSTQGVSEMNNVHRLPDTERIEREASDWIARLNADDVTAEDHAGFAVWRDGHPRHARIYEELSGTWREFREAGR